MLSVVIPAFNEEPVIPQTVTRIHGILRDAGIPHEILFVDDGSTDGTWAAISKFTETAPVRGVSFSRNFGKEAAIFAGLSAAEGACCAVIDCDLQHPPEKLVDMYRLWQQGWEIVNGVKAGRGRESVFHTLAAKNFYKLMSKAVKIDMNRSSDFKLMDRKVVDILLQFHEHTPFFRAQASWVGFRTAEVEFEVAERESGVSHWSVGALFRYAFSNIASYSTAPMQAVTFTGVLALLASGILGIRTIVCGGGGGHSCSLVCPAPADRRHFDDCVGNYRLLYCPYLRGM